MEQRTPEWYAQRRGRVTGSVAGAVLGLSPYMTRDDVMRMMVREYHGAEREFKGNVATEYGAFHERFALMDCGHEVTPCGFYAYEDWLGASPDGLIGDDALIEVKCPYGLHDKPAPVAFKPLGEQPHYELQMQIEMLCTGREWCWFFQWTPHGSAGEWVARRDISEELRHLRAFYDEYLREREKPDEYLAPKRAQINTNHAAKLIAEYDQLAESADMIAERRKAVLDELVQLAGERNAEICGRKLTQVEKAGAVSYAKAIKALCPDADLTPYTGKPSSYWKLT